jgi:hypothetical protein
MPEEIMRALKGAKRKQGRLELPEACKLLNTLLQSFSRVYICIDAIDECDAEKRLVLLQHLNQVLQDSTRTRLFLTGRPHVESEVNNRLKGSFPDAVRLVASKDDISKYIARKIDNDFDPDAMNESLKQEIMGEIAERSKGMYVFSIIDNH